MNKIGIVAVLSLLTVGIFTTGCGNGGSAGVSCDLKTTASHVCATYDYGSLDPSGAGATAEGMACTASKGTAGTSCPTTASLGTCTLVTSGITTSTTFYSDVGMVTVAAAKMACAAQKGTFK